MLKDLVNSVHPSCSFTVLILAVTVVETRIEISVVMIHTGWSLLSDIFQLLQLASSSTAPCLEGLYGCDYKIEPKQEHK
eukprot:801263-Amphidinium_carterae.1